MRALIAALVLSSAPAHALEIHARLPIKYGESFVVRNEGGINNWRTYFQYGTTCQLKWRLPMWLIVTRIVGDSVLLMVDLNGAMTEFSCPHGTETSMPLTQARQRYEDYRRAVEDKFMSDLNRID